MAWRWHACDATCRSWLLLVLLVAALGLVACRSDPQALSILAVVLAVATLGRLPLPIGDPIIQLLGSNSLLASISCVAVGCTCFVQGFVAAGLLLDFAAVILLYKCWSLDKAADAVRACFAEGGISLPAQDAAAQALDSAPLPIAMRLVPLVGAAFLCDGSLLPGAVTLRKHRFPVDDVTNYVDVWQPAGEPASARPLFFFIHGGAWRSMSPRVNAATRNLHAIAALGWTVVACSYRKARWPQQFDDSYAALLWTLVHVPGISRDSTLVIAGNSAGGHIASLVIMRALQEGVNVHGCVMGYPAVDPYDEGRHYPSLPFSFSPFGWHRGQSLLACWFQSFVLRGREELWPSARPLLQRALNSFPPTLVMHGDLDSIVPIEQSRRFLGDLFRARVEQPSSRDLLIQVPGARHSFEIGRDATAHAALVGMLAWLENVPNCPA